MEPQDERDLATPIICPNCGAPNTSDDARCRSCGMWLGGQGQVIDVTTGEPEPVAGPEAMAGGWQGGFQTATFDGGRVVVARGGGRTCLLVTVVAALVGCCLCWALWNGFGAIF